MAMAQLGRGSIVGKGGRGPLGRLRARLVMLMRGRRACVAAALAVILAAGLVILCAILGFQALGGGGGELIQRGAAAAAPSVTAGGLGDADEGDGSAEATATTMSADTSGADAAATAPVVVTVHVDGAVAVPGVYEVGGASPRVNDAIVAAGGLAADADTTSLNLAAAIADGDKVYVPRQGEGASAGGAGAAGGAAVGGGSASGGGTTVGSGTAGSDSAAGGGSSGGSGATALVNINTATATELDELPGVGPSTAQAIVDDREQNGPFASVEDLMRVSGIGEKKFEKLRGRICV